MKRAQPKKPEPSPLDARRFATALREQGLQATAIDLEVELELPGLKPIRLGPVCQMPEGCEDGSLSEGLKPLQKALVGMLASIEACEDYIFLRIPSESGFHGSWKVVGEPVPSRVKGELFGFQNEPGELIKVATGA